MGKRQINILPQQIATTPKLVGQEVNIFTTDAKVKHGYITSVSSDAVKFKDTRQHEHTVKISDIKQIYADVVADF
jgi:hypothetical protein